MQDDRTKQAGIIRVLIADNSRFHTQLLVEVLGRDPGLDVVGSELDAASLMASSVSQKVDVFVLSAFVDEDAQRGFGILLELRKNHPNTRAIMLLDSSNTESVLEAFRAGARGVFDHRESSDGLCQCIRWASDEHMALVFDSLASALKVRAVDRNGMNLLSKREEDVVHFVAEGLTNREIAERLGLSQHTIKNYLFHIFDKLGVSNRTELLFMTLGHDTPTPSLQDILTEPSGHYDEATIALCEKAAENGVLAAQLMLADIFLTRRASDSDANRAYVWFSVALNQLTRSRNNAKKAMSSADLAEAECEIRERLNEWERIEAPLVAREPSHFQRTVVA